MATKIKFVVADKIPNSTKWGCNIMEGGEKNLAAMIPLAKTMGFTTYHYNCISGIKDDAAAALVISFAQAVGAKLGIHLPIWRRLPPDYYEWVVKTYGAVVDFFQLDNESLTTPTPMSNEQYIVLCREVMARYPQYTYSWDLGLFYRLTSSLHVARNTEIAKQPAPPSEGRQYAQLADVLLFSSNQSINVDLIKNYGTTLFPLYLGELKKIPNVKKINVLQFLIENAGEEFLTDAVTNYAISEYLRLVLTNTESFARVFWMQIANLMGKGVASPEYNSIKRFIPATKFRYVVPLDIKIDGVSGIGVYDGVDSFGLWADNATSTEHKIAANEIKIFGKKISGIIVRDSGWTTNWNSPITNESSVADIQTLLRPNSSNYITFKTSQVIGES